MRSSNLEKRGYFDQKYRWLNSKQENLPDRANTNNSCVRKLVFNDISNVKTPPLALAQPGRKRKLNFDDIVVAEKKARLELNEEKVGLTIDVTAPPPNPITPVVVRKAHVCTKLEFPSSTKNSSHGIMKMLDSPDKKEIKAPEITPEIKRQSSTYKQPQIFTWSTAHIQLSGNGKLNVREEMLLKRNTNLSNKDIFKRELRAWLKRSQETSEKLSPGYMQRQKPITPIFFKSEQDFINKIKETMRRHELARQAMEAEENSKLMRVSP